MDTSWPWQTRMQVAQARGQYGTQAQIFRRKLLLGYVSAAGCALRSGSRSAPARSSSITSWSRGMGRRLRDTIDNFHRDFRVMATLTYPEDYPTDGRSVKGHFRALVERARRVGLLKTDSWVWWLEFQARGAPHFHFVGTGYIPKAWLAKAWSEVTGGNVRVATRIEALRKPEAAGAYAAKYAAKQEQKEVPAEFTRVGRFWGVVGWGRSTKAKKISLGQTWPRPSLTAVLLRRTPDDLAAKIFSLGVSLRAFETPVGWVMYGAERVLRRVWAWLMGRSAKSCATTTTTGVPSPPRMQAA